MAHFFGGIQRVHLSILKHTEAVKPLRQAEATLGLTHKAAHFLDGIKHLKKLWNEKQQEGQKAEKQESKERET